MVNLERWTTDRRADAQQHSTGGQADGLCWLGLSIELGAGSHPVGLAGPRSAGGPAHALQLCAAHRREKALAPQPPGSSFKSHEGRPGGRRPAFTRTDEVCALSHFRSAPSAPALRLGSIKRAVGMFSCSSFSYPHHLLSTPIRLTLTLPSTTCRSLDRLSIS